MAVKTFTTGEVLTAADTNTYLNNGGLVYVKSQTVGSAVTSVTVSDAFSSTYDNYRIQFVGGVGSTGLELRMTLGSANTNYYGNLLFQRPNASTPSGVGNDNIAYWQYGGFATTNWAFADVELFGPNLAKPTGVYTKFIEFAASAAGLGYYVGFQSATTQFTAFTFTASSGTFTGGTINVYGYRKA